MSLKDYFRSNRFKKFCLSFNLGLFLGLLLLGIFVSWVGLHNLDVAQNIEMAEYEAKIMLLSRGIYDFDFTYYETNIYGELVDLADAYRVGVAMVLFGVIIIFLGAFGFGGVIQELLSGWGVKK